MKQRILVTGFKPFQGESINPSQLIIRELAASEQEDLEVLLLPVSYDRSFALLEDHWEQEGPFDAVLMLGQAGGRKSIALERVALNWSENKAADEDGVQRSMGTIVEDAPSAHISDFFPTEWADALNKVAPTEISHSAGTYVCNALYFQALHTFPQDVAVLFVHLPYVPEQVVGKAPGTPSMEFQTQLKAIEGLIRLIKNS